MLSIGELAHLAGVKVPTIRYYEKKGLIMPPDRSQGNQRRYEQDAVKRLQFIKHARELGLKLEAIADLIALASDPDKPCAKADEIARQHLTVVRSKIERLLRLEKELIRIAANHKGNRIGECYVIQALSDHGLCQHDH